MEVDSLELVIESNVDQTIKALDKLEAALGKLNSITSSVSGLEQVAGGLKKIASASASLNSAGLGNLSTLVEVLSKLKNVGTVNMPDELPEWISRFSKSVNAVSPDSASHINILLAALGGLSNVPQIALPAGLGTNLKGIVKAIGEMGGVDYSNITQFTTAIGGLSVLNGMKISTTIAKQIVEIATAAQVIEGVNYQGITDMGNALQGLSGLGTTTLGSFIKQLKELPSIVPQINALDMNTFTTNVNALVKALNPLAQTLSQMPQNVSAVSNTVNTMASALNKSSVAANNATTRHGTLSNRIKALAVSYLAIAKPLTSFIDNSNKYIEDLNLFTASMGQYAEKARDYAESVGEIMGIDPAEWMRNQGVFNVLAEGFGVASDRAYTMSKNLTQLGYDIASFFNIDVQDAMQKLQSGLSGELEPLRRLGYDLSEARLKAVALGLGITDTYSKMTQAQKAQLRYYAIMTQVTTAQGDMARTLEAPANQLRVFKAQVTQAARALGNVFIPALNAILPAAISAIKVIRALAESIASMFGYALPEIDYSSVDSAKSSVDGLGDSLASAGGSAKALKNALMGFDEINQFPSEGSGGGGGGSSSLDDTAWNFDLPVYDFIQGLTEKLQPNIEWIQNHANQIAPVVAAIATSFLQWKLADTLLSDLNEANGLLGYINGMVGELALITIGAVVTYKLTQVGLEDNSPINILASGGSDAIGALLSKQIGNKIFGEGDEMSWILPGINLGIDAAVTIGAIYNGVKMNGLSAAVFVAEAKAGIEAAIAGSMIAKALGVSMLAGGVIGLTIAVGVIAAVTLVAVKKNQEQAEIASLFGDEVLSPAEIREYAESFYTVDVEATVNLLDVSVMKRKEMKQRLDELVLNVGGSIKNIKLGVELDKTEQDAILADVNSLVDTLTHLVEEQDKQITLTMGIAPIYGEDGTTLNEQYAKLSKDSQLTGYIQDLGTRLSDAMKKGFTEGFNDSLNEYINTIQTGLFMVEEALTTGQTLGEYTAERDILLANLTQDSLSEAWAEYERLRNELETSLSEANEENLKNMLGQATALEAVSKTYEKLAATADKDGAIEQAQEYRKMAEEAKEAAEAWKLLYDDASKGKSVDINMGAWDGNAIDKFTNEYTDKIKQWSGYVDTQEGILDGGLIFDESLAKELHDEVVNYGVTLEDALSDMFEDYGLSTYLIEALDKFEVPDSLKGSVLKQLFGGLTFADGFFADLYAEFGDGLITALSNLGITVTPEMLGIDEITAEVTNGVDGAKDAVDELNEAVLNSGVVDAMAGIAASTAEIADAKKGIDETTATANDATKAVKDIGTQSKVVLASANGLERAFDGVATMNLTGSSLDSSISGVDSKVTSVSEHIANGLKSFRTLSGMNVKPKLTLSANATSTDEFKKTTTLLWELRGGGSLQTYVQQLFDSAQMFASGGYPTAGQLFIANEAGAEMVGTINGKTAVANQDEIGDAIFQYMDAHAADNGEGVDEDRLANAIVSAMREAGIGTIQLDGRTLANSINRASKAAGRPVITI